MTWYMAGMALWALAILCEAAHVISPIGLAWSHPGLRQIALSRPIETLLLPVVAIIGALAAPLWVIGPIYWWWNAYHFGAQHYGVGRICGLCVPRWLCVGGTMAIMAAGPYIMPLQWWHWFFLFALGFPHWLTDVGLSSRVSRHWWLFLGSVLALGCVGFAWLVPRADHIATRTIPWVVKARWGIGIDHFLYSRWVWKLSDPQVRAAIGRDFLGAKA